MENDMNDTAKREVSFPLGQLLATRGVIAAIEKEEVLLALRRHARGDWGDVCAADRSENELSLREGFRLLSVYHTEKGQKFWVITEADRSATTVLLPDEY